MGEEFLTGYINLAEGEKDPRNLLVAFAIARVLLIEFDTKHHVEVSHTKDSGCSSLFIIPLCIATFQHHVLLLPDHVPAASRRSIRHHD